MALYLKISATIFILFFSSIAPAIGGPLTITYPRDGAIFPVDMAFSPTFKWKDAGEAESWEIEIHGRHSRGLWPRVKAVVFFRGRGRSPVCAEQSRMDS